MARIMKQRSRKAGLPPGTLVHIGEKKSEKILMELILFSENEYSRIPFKNIDATKKYFGKSSNIWLNIDGLYQPEIIQKVGEFLNLHPLLQEDILNTAQRPKFEEYDGCIFLVTKMLSWVNNRICSEQISLVLGTDFLISFQEQPGDIFDPIRERLSNSKGRIRKLGSDYLTYTLLDAIVDNYFIILEQLDEKLEQLEEEVTTNPTPDTLQKIHHLKREILLLRKSAWPLRDVISSLEHSESKLIREGTIIFIKDVYDHVIQVIDTIETFQELLSGMLDIYLSSISNRMNEIMKVLTVISTIFIPLTFIVGIYGMNFQYMPELNWRWGYLLILLVMGILAGLMVRYFKRKRWL